MHHTYSIILLQLALEVPLSVTANSWPRVALDPGIMTGHRSGSRVPSKHNKTRFDQFMFPITVSRRLKRKKYCIIDVKPIFNISPKFISYNILPSFTRSRNSGAIPIKGVNVPIEIVKTAFMENVIYCEILVFKSFTSLGWNAYDFQTTVSNAFLQSTKICDFLIESHGNL